MTTSEETRQCPYCAETIRSTALICRFCNRNLQTGEIAAPVPPTTGQEASGSAGSTPVVQARSGVMDGVKLGAGMFIVLPLLCILGLVLLCSLGGVLGR